MENTATTWVLGSCAGAILLCSVVVPNLSEASSPPDMTWRGAAAGFDVAGPPPASAPVTASLASGPGFGYGDGMFAAAPMGETAASKRTAQPPQRGVTIAIGTNAKNMCDPAFENGFATLVTDLDISFASCTDRDAVELRLCNRVDLTLLGGSLSQRERSAGLRETRIGLELFALAVAADFPLQSLSQSQVRQLLTGQVRDWQQVGSDRGAVVVVVPADKSLQERAARQLILGDNFSQNALRTADDRHVTDQILRNPGAIAVVRVKATPTAGMKLLQIDWTPPTAEAFGFGTYPYGVPLSVVTSGEPDAIVRRFLNYAASEDGRELLGRTLLLR